ncbi:MAG: ABC transporter ATP-binding protein [Anaerolineae bacterium]|nr:MAG: ABC transporter ATP-binding protein [Anaerolineae bacterium]
MPRGFFHRLNSSPLDLGELQLLIDNVSLSFGGVQALRKINLTVNQGEIMAIIGPNGAGKTSLLNCISGLYNPQIGQIIFYHDGQFELTSMKPHQITKLGIARSFQNIELFKHMTVLDNLMLGRHVHLKSNLFTGGIFWGWARREEVENRFLVEDIIDLLEIQSIRKQPVGTLSYGLQKRVELGRALALQPSLLILDEPMAGMNAEEKEDLARFVLDINEEHGVTIIIIEHDMGVVMDISDRVAVLDFGSKIGEGTAEEVQRSPEVIRAYLGEDYGPL